MSIEWVGSPILLGGTSKPLAVALQICRRVFFHAKSSAYSSDSKTKNLVPARASQILPGGNERKNGLSPGRSQVRNRPPCRRCSGCQTHPTTQIQSSNFRASLNSPRFRCGKQNPLRSPADGIRPTSITRVYSPRDQALPPRETNARKGKVQLLRAVRKGEGRSYAWLNGAGHDTLQGVVSNNMPATNSKIVQTPPEFVSSAMKSCAAADWSVRLVQREWRDLKLVQQLPDNAPRHRRHHERLRNIEAPHSSIADRAEA
jgi:hypothetical protein